METLPALAPGVCLTFDDLFVENWRAALPVFAAHGAVASFCVCHLHQATADQLTGLHALQEAGHEIAYHSRTHPKLAPYLERHGLEVWVAEELDRGIEEHRTAGFPATAFAAPFHASTPETRRAVATRFEIARTKGPNGAERGGLAKRVYREPGRGGRVHNIASIDMGRAGAEGWSRLNAALEATAVGQGVSVFTGHDIRRDPGRTRFYLSQADLDRILTAVRARGLAFYTLTDFARRSRKQPPM